MNFSLNQFLLTYFNKLHFQIGFLLIFIDSIAFKLPLDVDRMLPLYFNLCQSQQLTFIDSIAFKLPLNVDRMLPFYFNPCPSQQLTVVKQGALDVIQHVSIFCLLISYSPPENYHIYNASYVTNYINCYFEVEILIRKDRSQNFYFRKG